MVAAYLPLVRPVHDCWTALVRVRPPDHRNSGQHLHNLHLHKKGSVSHRRKSREALDHIMQWHVHVYLAIWSQECLLVTDSTSSMYGPRTEMGAQLKEKSLGVLWYKRL